jgi:hypothetical protein
MRGVRGIEDACLVVLLLWTGMVAGGPHNTVNKPILGTPLAPLPLPPPSPTVPHY